MPDVSDLKADAMEERRKRKKARTLGNAVPLIAGLGLHCGCVRGAVGEPCELCLASATALTTPTLRRAHPPLGPLLVLAS